MMSCDVVLYHLGHDTLQVASEIISTVTDPRAMIGPEVIPSTLYSCRTVLLFSKTGFFDDQVSRDHTAKQEEKKGTIRFQLIHNSLKHKPSDDHLLWMLELKQIFSRQLPRMPVDYITRIVFDM